MALQKFVFKNGTLKVAGVDLSTATRNVDIPMAKDQVEADSLNGNGIHQFLPGLGNERFVVQFANGFDSAGVYATLYPLYRNESQFEVEAIGLAGAASATNPRWRAFCQLYDYNPISAQVGALSVVTVNFIATEPITPYTT